MHKSLSAPYEYSITPLRTMPTKKLTIEYVTICVMYEMSKRKKKNVETENAAMLLRQGKAVDPPS